MIHPRDTKQQNPRVQCDVCGKWARIYKRDGTQTMFGGCYHNDGDHMAAGASQDVCHACCVSKCGGEFKG